VESITVPVPPAQAGAARHVLRRLFDVKAEALHQASEAFLAAPNVGPRPPHPVAVRQVTSRRLRPLAGCSNSESKACR
jgi:hypothetical protein